MRLSALFAASTLATAIVLTGCSSSGATSSNESTQGGTGDKTASPSAEVKYYENGDHIVGTDIKAGVYRAEVEEGAITLCTVSQTSKSDKVMDVRNASEGSVIFTVADKSGTVVSFSGCTNIAKASDVVRKNAKPGNGWFLVGTELAPGKYTGKVDTDSLMKLGTITQFSAKGSVMSIRNANSGNVVFTVKASTGSVVSFSGFTSVKKVG